MKEDIRELNLKELNCLLKHLKLGSDHLKRKLNPDQFKELLKWVPIEEKQETRIEDNKKGKVSHFMPVLNTIFTSIFGAALGFSAMIGYDLSIPTRIAIIGFSALFISFVMGYVCHKRTQERADQTEMDLKILKNQQTILTIIHDRLKEDSDKVLKLYHLIFTRFSDLGFKLNKTHQLETDENLNKELLSLTQLLKRKIQKISKETTYIIYRSYLLKKIKKINHLLQNQSNHVEKINLFDLNENSLQSLSFLRVLTDLQSVSTKKAPFDPAKNESINIFYDILPTLLGTFASLFVFANGIPDIAHQLGATEIEHFFSHQHARIAELIIMVIVTTYFGVCFFYARKKSQLRKKEIQTSRKKIIDTELVVQEVEIKINRLNHIYYQLEYIFYILTVVQKLEQSRSDSQPILIA